MSILSRLKNLFKAGQLLSTDDSGDIRTCFASYMGKEQKIVLMTPYGLMHNPPVDSLLYIGDQLAQASNGVGMADDPENRPLKDLEEGEVGLGNYLTGDYIKFAEDGSVKIKNATTTISTAADGTIIIVNPFSSIIMNAAGRIDITADARVQLTAPVIGMTGSLNVTGAIWTSGNVVANGQIKTDDPIALTTHTHSSGAPPDNPS